MGRSSTSLRRYRSLLAMLVFGNGLVWLAWSHWCFVRPEIYAS